MQELAGISDDDLIWQQWLTSPWVRRFESGRCSPTEFATGVVAEWDLTITPDRFLELFRDWPVGPFVGSSTLLAEVKDQLPIGCLSNTNRLHWEHQFAQWPILEQFQQRFLSFDLGLVKPDPAVFSTVASQLGSDPARILFLDDVLLNVEAARSFGYRSIQVHGTVEARLALVNAGVLDP